MMRALTTVLVIPCFLFASLGAYSRIDAQDAVSGIAVIVGAGSYDNLPDIASVSEDKRQLEQAFSVLFGAGSVRQLEITASIETQLAALAQRVRKDELQSIVVYVVGHMFERDGRRFLAYRNTDLSGETPQGLDLEKLLALFDEKTSTSCSKLLLLDCPENEDSRGLSATDFAEQLDERLQALVVTSADIGQSNNVTSGGGGSVFADCLRRGLSGEADRDDDFQVSLREIGRYLSIAIPEAAAQLGKEQVPVVRGLGVNAALPFASLRSKRKDLQKLTFVNKEKGADAKAYIRVDGRQSVIAPAATIVLEVSPSSKLEYFRGDGGWQPLLPNPMKSHEFKLSASPVGPLVWLTGFTNSIGVQMTLVHAGRFQMGQRQADLDMIRRYAMNDTPAFRDQLANELPNHNVEISKAFYCGNFEIQVKEFARFVSATGYRTNVEEGESISSSFIDGTGQFDRKQGLSWRNPGFPQTDSHPVVHVTWMDADRFCKWLTFKEKVPYSLPTEAQWEYAARGGTTTPYWNGNSPEALTRVGNVRDGTLRRQFPGWSDTTQSSDGYTYTAPVGRFPSNPFGIHDTHGNVWEWCNDWYQSDFYSESPQRDPIGPAGGRYHVYRGGCFY